MEFVSCNQYYLCCGKGLIRVIDQQVTTLLNGSDVKCIQRITDDTFIVGTDKKLLIMNMDTMTAVRDIIDGDFRSIKRLTHNTFIVKSNSHLIVVNDL